MKLMFALLFVSTCQATTLFDSHVNQYGSIEVRICDTSICDTGICDTSITDTSTFEEQLSYSLKHWKAEGYNAVWLALPNQLFSYLPILEKYQFSFHHSSEKSIIMALWLKEDSKNILPDFSAHAVGVCGLVIDGDKVLAVKERYGVTERYGLPGSGLDLGEHLWAAAIREVKEETGIDTEFQALLGFRHGNIFSVATDQLSKLYFCILLRPLSKEINIQEEEIQEAAWLPIAEFKKQAGGSAKDFIAMYEECRPSFLKAQIHQERNFTFYHA